MQEEEVNLDETLEVQEEVETPSTNPQEEVDIEELKKKAEAYEAQKIRAEKAEAETKALKSKPQPIVEKSSLGVEDYIDISASLEGLDQREKEYLAQQHKYTGQSLKEIRNSEDFKLWQTAYQQKVEKEKLVMKPSNGSTETDKPTSLEDSLNGLDLAEAEKLLEKEYGYRIGDKRRADTVQIKKGF